MMSIDMKTSQTKIRRSMLYMLVIPVLITLIVFCVTHGIWQLDLRAPFIYRWRDDLNHGSLVLRAMYGDLTIWTDDHLGYPYSMTQYAFPHIPWAAVLWAYFCGLFTKNYPFVINSYYIIGFCLTTVIFCYVAQKLKVSYSLSVTGGLLYAFCQFHSLHRIEHLTASSYYAVPLVVLICFMICGQEEQQINKKTVLLLVITGNLISISDMFYAFWGCMLIGLSGLLALINKKYKNVIVAVLAIICIAGVTILLLSPAVIYSLNHETLTAKRTAYDTFFWGLKLITLITPGLEGHPLAFMKDLYMNGSMHGGEDLFNYLGIIGTVGLIWLCLVPLIHKKDIHQKETLKKISLINIMALLIGVSGGIGLIVSILVTAKVRVYNRITVYIYCCAILAFIILADGLFAKWRFGKRRMAAVLVCIMILHIADMQYLPFALPELQETEQWPYDSLAAEKYQEDKAFVETLKMTLPGGAKLLYLPYLDFPENKTENGLDNYTRGIITNLFDSGLYTSFGLIYGTKESILMKSKYKSDDLDQIIAYAVSDGFDYILVDEKALKEKSAITLNENLSEILGVLPIISQDDYKVYPLNREIKEKYAEKAVGVIVFTKGFYPIESNEANYWIWADQTADIYIEGTGDTHQDPFMISFELSGFGEVDRDIRIEGCGVDTSYHLASGEQMTVELWLDPAMGDKLHISSSAESEMPTENDGRALNFMIKNWTMRHAE